MKIFSLHLVPLREKSAYIQHNCEYQEYSFFSLKTYSIVCYTDVRLYSYF